MIRMNRYRELYVFSQSTSKSSNSLKSSLKKNKVPFKYISLSKITAKNKELMELMEITKEEVNNGVRAVITDTFKDKKGATKYPIFIVYSQKNKDIDVTEILSILENVR